MRMAKQNLQSKIDHGEQDLLNNNMNKLVRMSLTIKSIGEKIVEWKKVIFFCIAQE